MLVIFTPVSLALTLVLARSRQYIFVELMNARATDKKPTSGSGDFYKGHS